MAIGNVAISCCQLQTKDWNIYFLLIFNIAQRYLKCSQFHICFMDPVVWIQEAEAAWICLKIGGESHKIVMFGRQNDDESVWN